MSDFQGRAVLVVGGGGIGAEVCRQVAATGGRVYFTYNSNIDAARALAATIPGELLGGHAQLDVADEVATASLVAEASEAMDGIDALVCTVGYLHHLSLFEEVEMSTVRHTIEIELFGVLNLAKSVLPVMRRAGYGRIVTVGSDSGKVGSKAEAASAAARGGVIAFSKAIARETASSDICVNVVCPGPTETQLLDSMLADEGLSGKLMNAMVRAIPKRRAATAAEVAAVAVFLASEQASFVTGQAISASGGLTMC
ncbi:MAG TPA: SDR family oxidoreductase [Streptosporangiaceae bacterium]|nr:SDR family oxidoreductase [Streptosporangiaceae bacterium]